ncbi:MAG: aminotransferase class III-fold pyridoxal phosphate-dependent enzyme [Sphaerochaetaceae bacterium]
MLLQYLLTLLEEGSLLRHVQQVSTYLRSQLENRYPQVIEIRGMGLMVGLEFDQAVRPIIDEAMNKGLLLVNAGEKVLRMVPPLTITEDEIDEALQILDAILLS